MSAPATIEVPVPCRYETADAECGLFRTAEVALLPQHPVTYRVVQIGRCANESHVCEPHEVAAMEALAIEAAQERMRLTVLGLIADIEHDLDASIAYEADHAHV